MKKEDYNTINEYLNNLALFLFDSEDVETYYYKFMYLNDCYLDFFWNRYFSENAYRNEVKQNHMTFQDVIDISRKIIESINPKYIEQFDSLLERGLLNFSYEDEYSDSHVQHVFYKGELQRRVININRTFNYTEIETLIHEFMHCVCFMGQGVKNRVIGEFISIYYELYAIEQLYKEYNANLDELFYNRRLLNIYYQACRVRDTELLLYFFKSFGDIDEESYKNAAVFMSNYTKEKYDYECGKTLEIINKQKSDEEEAFEIEKSHVYVMATFLAFYFRKKVPMEKMNKFIENAYKEENQDLDIFELLSKYNLNMEGDIKETIFESMNEYLNIFEADKKQRN